MKFKEYLVKLIKLYQKFLSPAQGYSRYSGCVFYPSCSEYTKQALERYGTLKGLYLGFFRVLRCHPWQKNHMDPLK